jgi:uncharacterized OsmC-like protein
MVSLGWGELPMQIAATVRNQGSEHHVTVRTGDKEQPMGIPARAGGQGSGVNGGELLFVALATCFCNDVYREARERGIGVTSVEVEVTGRFGGKGEPAEEIRYRTTVEGDAGEEELRALLRYTDSVAEVHNTLRRGTAVTLDACTVRGR